MQDASSKQQSESEVTQSCSTLCDPMDCSLSGSSVHGIFQARVLEWIAISFSRGSSRPKNQTWVSQVAGRCFTSWATREAPLNNKQNKNTNQIISRQEYQSHSALPIRGKTNKQKLSTSLILYEAYTNDWTNFRRAETKGRKDSDKNSKEGKWKSKN